DGAFVLEAGEAGNYEVAARPEPPRAGTRASASVTPAKPEATVQLVVLAGSRLVGRVVDPADQGLAAVVRGTRTQGSGGDGTWVYTPPARTDASGGFVFEAVPAGKGTLSVTLPGRMSLSGVEVTTP